MDDLYIDEMEPPCRDMVVAVPGRGATMEHRPIAPVEPPRRRALRRLRTVACGFPDRRLRLSLQVAQLRRGG